MAELTTLHDLLVDHLRDLYSAEEQIIAALPKMAAAASSPRLRTAFEDHLAQSKVHRDTLMDLFDTLGKSPEGHTCKAMQGIIKEGEETVKEDAAPEVKDAALIAAAQRVEHYEMAGYGCVRTWSRLLGMDDMADSLQTILDQEGETDHKLTALAESIINPRAV